MNKKLLLLCVLPLALSGCSNTKQDNDKYDYVLLAQPVVSAVLSVKSNFKISNNVQVDYKAKSNNLEITQASIFVKNNADEGKVNAFLSMISSEVSELLADPETVLPAAVSSLQEQFVTGKLGGKTELLSKLLKNNNQLGLGYKEAFGNKEAIDAFIGTLGLPATKDTHYFNVSSCDPTETLDIKVAVPSGAPAVAFYKHLSDANLEVSAAETVLAYLTDTGDKDIVIAPTNAGIAAINKGMSFKLAATITFGNFFIVSTGNDDNDTMDKGDKVLAFQQNGVAGKLFNYVYGDKELDVTFVADAVTVKNTILTEEY